MAGFKNYDDVFKRVIEIDPELKPILDYAVVDTDVSTSDLVEMASSPNIEWANAARTQLIRQYIKNCVDYAYQRYLKTGDCLSDLVQKYITKLVELVNSNKKNLAQDLRRLTIEADERQPETITTELNEDMVDDTDYVEIVINHRMLEDVLYSMSTALSDREADLLKYRFGFTDGQTYTLEETANRFGVTRERVRQLEAKALRRLRSNQETRHLLLHYVED